MQMATAKGTTLDDLNLTYTKQDKIHTMSPPQTQKRCGVI